MVPGFERKNYRVKVAFFWREKKAFAARGWASASSYLHPPIIPSNAFVGDKVVVFLV
jgi:hypothetical protein